MGAVRRGLVLAALALAALAPPPPAAAEAIRSFDVSIRLSASTDFEVEERIRWDFEGASKHGIYRRIPLDRSGPRLRIDIASVTDEAGAPWPWRVSSRGGWLEIRIGDPDATVTGVQEYRIRYRVARGLLYFDEHDELYWNATGNDWPVRIDAASATVALPPGAGTGAVRRTCFAGPTGSTFPDCSIDDAGGELRFASEDALAPGSGLTIVVGLPKGVLPEPSALRRALDHAGDVLSVWMLLPIAAAGFVWRQWRRHGRDPQGAAALPVRYEPPPGFTPAEVGTVVDESADSLDLTATILDLAVRGLMRIEEVEGAGFSFLSSRDYRLHRTGASDAGLKEHERLLLAGLFQGGSPVLVSDLKDRFYEKVPGILQALYREVSGRGGCFAVAPDQIRNRYRIAGAAVAGLSVVAGWTEQSIPAIVSPLVAAGIVVGFSGAMPRRTEKGRRTCDDILGFREFVRRVDGDRLERSGGRTAERFEKILPYAVVLGVADRWATVFSDIYTAPPEWYGSTRYGGGFRTQDFVSDVGRSLSTMGSTFASRPSSGSSGFSGGSSGGGGGGGGGGSW